MNVLNFPRHLEYASTSHGEDAPVAGALDVLIVEKDDDMRSLLREMLGLLGCATRTAISEADALSFCESRAPDLAICSMRLWDGSGLELARQIRALPGLDFTTLVAFTGGGLDGSASAVFDCVLLKPLAYETLQRFIEPFTARLASQSGAQG